MNEANLLGMRILQDDSIAQKFNAGGLPLYTARENIDGFPDRRTIPHWNVGLETVYIRTGTMKMNFAGKEIVLCENDIAVIDPGCVHYFEGLPDTECVYDCFVMDEALFPSVSSLKEKYLTPLFRAEKPAAGVLRANNVSCRSLAPLLEKIRMLCRESGECRELPVAALCMEFLSLLYESSKPMFLREKDKTDSESALKNMVSFIRLNYARQVSIEMLCKAGGVSRNRCFCIFRTFTGDTPANYILKYRLKVSENHLVNTDMPISEIAAACGFAHQSHYTGRFCEQYGMTPLKYRKACRDRTGTERRCSKSTD